MGLWDIFIAAWLSQYNLMGPFKVMPRLVRMIFIQSSSQIPWAMALNLASALDLATISCFLLLQVTRFPPKKVKYPNLLLTIDPAQSTSLWATS